MRTPVVVVTGIDRAAMDSVMMGFLWDLQHAVAVQHCIDPWNQTLTRVVSDITGVIESETISLEHACISCALREDILPTLERLGRDGRWRSIVACLPIAAEAEQLGQLLARNPRFARHLRLATIVAAADPDGLAGDLLGDGLLRERDLHSNPGDDRGVGEAHSSLLEYADLVVLTSPPAQRDAHLVEALIRPGVPIVIGAENIDVDAVVAGRSSHADALAWRMPIGRSVIPPLPGGSTAWRIDLSSPRPFHPDRLVEQISRLGEGEHRSRGCFWLPTRPGLTAQWDGAGGQLSIGPHPLSGHHPPITRLVFTGLGQVPAGLVAAFDDLLVTPAEEGNGSRTWRVAEDGLEPWLGDIEHAA
jgi:G3E family GTPase